MGSVSGATAALARILAAESGVNTIRVTSTAGNLVMLHQLLEAGQTAARRRLATSAGARVAPSGATPPTDGESGSLPRAAGSEGLAASLRSAQDVLRTLAESRRRREEQLASLHATAEQLGILIPLEVQRLEGGAASRSTENQAAAPHERVTWTALSSAVDVETPCQHCRTVIPPRFLRMRRFATGGRAGASTRLLPSQHGLSSFVAPRDTSRADHRGFVRAIRSRAESRDCTVRGTHWTAQRRALESDERWGVSSDCV